MYEINIVLLRQKCPFQNKDIEKQKKEIPAIKIVRHLDSEGCLEYSIHVLFT